MPGAIPLESVDILEAQREDWEAPWMVGLVDRVEDGIEGEGVDNTASVDGEGVDVMDGASGTKSHSDLHNEILRFSEYVSLTPAEVRPTLTLLILNGP